ncbi:putative sulfite oxidase [Mytilinidion resinicola]|uniref:Sulfite oxidase n=1 Tax=Mytilinidion resinicola TaxID=574789 RepID=A0A6A6Z6D9_9PEZI|nr:putative sulfite oxidase [Mytilinidion resinicola]KAF2816672.1 putative sulfite oxidase [Mytilinidion resinicola]
MVKLEHTVRKPLNREPPLEKLISSFITEEGGYDRNHGPIPYLDASTHRVAIYGAVTQQEFSIGQLSSLPQHTVICALQCAGNRRHTMRTKLKEVNGIDWFDGAVMNCRWRGPRLRDVLLRSGMDLPREKWKDAHVAFACFQTPCQDDEYYGGSIPLERAMQEDADVILALEMNGRPLTPNHGFPVRVVTPGIAGARSVKWLDRITVQLCESSNFYQQRDYKILPEEADCVEKAKEWWDKCPSIVDMPVNSVIAVPASESTVKRDENGVVYVKGYALPSGQDGPVTQVEVSADGGKTWVLAELAQAESPEKGVSLKWSWTLWQAKVKPEPGTGKKFLSRAMDKGGNVQAPCPKWNLRGVSYNGYGESENVEVI